MRSKWSKYPPFYEFLSDDYFDTGRARNSVDLLQSATPHDLWNSEGYLRRVRGIGTKGEMNILQVMKDWKQDVNGTFCQCGEPMLDWYKYCPVCGKERQEK